MSRVTTALSGGCLLICALIAVNEPTTAEQPTIDGPSSDAETTVLRSTPSWPHTWLLLPAVTTPVEPKRPHVDHVVFISVDGLNAKSVKTLGPGGAPTFHRMISEGASTLNARTAVEQTRTLPNHASMISGRKIATSGGHGVTFNADNGSTIHASAGGYVASIFDVVHDNGGSTAMYVGKTKFDFFDRSWNAANGAPDVTGVDDGRDKIDVYEVADDPTTMATLLAQLGSPAPDTLSLVHLADTDNVGHASGFMSAAYLDAVAVVDRYLGRLLDTVAANPELADRTVVIVTTDHGGASGTFDHADRTVAANYTVPFLVWGAGVGPGADLYSLNPDRANPDTAQPSYREPVPPIRTGEAANLIAGLLGYGPVPGATFNSDQSLDLLSLNPSLLPRRILLR